MTVIPIRPRDLVLPALVAAVVVHLLVRLGYGSLPSFPLAAGLPFAVLGAAEAIGGTALRSRIRDRTGARPVEPLIAARAVLVARASAQAGAIMTGAWVGLLVYVAPRSADIAAAADDTAAAALGAVGALVLVGGGLWLQHCCRTPDDPDDPKDGVDRERRPQVLTPRRRRAQPTARTCRLATANVPTRGGKGGRLAGGGTRRGGRVRGERRGVDAGSAPVGSLSMAVASPHLPTPGRQRRAVLGTVAGLVVFGVCGLVVLGLVSGSIGVGAVLVGAAVRAGAGRAGRVRRSCGWTAGSPSRRAPCCSPSCGAPASPRSARCSSTAAPSSSPTRVLGQGSGDVLGASVIAPIVEEGVKGAFVVGLLIFRRREFDGIVDGIVYAGLVGAGFAFTENILYMGRAFAESGGLVGQDGGVLAVLILRGVLSPFAHPLFTSMTGIGCGLAAVSRSAPARVLYVLVGYALAVVLHALWNSSATLSAAARRSWGSTSSSWCRCSSP